MSYIALYRKYRPRRFCDVVGQETVVEVLKNSIKNNHISHAYLFTGPRGTGKTSIAKIFAKAVNCLNFDDDICDSCQVCKYMKENDSDVIEIDAASNNGVDEIRTLRENVKLMPAFCKYKIYIIDEVHMLSTGAFNALLKTLEEPPSHVIFILATTEPNKIPITIMSRCQRFDFDSISGGNIYKKLTEICTFEHIELNDEIIKYVAENSDGGLRDAINLLDQVVSLGKKSNTTLVDIEKISGKISTKIIIEIYKSIINKDYLSLLKITDTFILEGKNLKDIVNMLLTVLRDLSIINDVNDYFDKSYTDKLLELSFPKSKILEVSNVLNKLLNEMKYSNNESMIFQIYILSLIDICSVISKNEESTKKNISEKIINIETTKMIPDINDKEANEEKSTLNELKKIRVNNCLAEADKLLLNSIVNNYEKINEYSSNKKYNNVVEILNNGKIVAASPKYLMFEYKNESELIIFENVYKEIENFLNMLFESEYKIVGLTKDEWAKAKEQYVINKKNNIKYIIIDENVVKLNVEKTPKLVENSASDIFGDNAISMK